MNFSVFLGLRVGMRINCKWVQEIWGRGIDAKCSKTRLWSWRHNSVNLLFKNLFIYGCAGSLLLCGLVSGCSEQGLLSSRSAWASHWRGFSCCGARAPVMRASIVAAHRLVSCGPSSLQASAAVAHGVITCGARLSFSMAYGIFPDQGSNPCPLLFQCTPREVP